MSSEQQAPADQILCKTGCGFFGSNATGDLCSKCWNSKNSQREANTITGSKPSPKLPPTCVTVKSGSFLPEDEPPIKTNVNDINEPEACSEEVTSALSRTPLKKKKKKKQSYKNMMNSLLQGSGEKDVEIEKEKLKAVTGGGAFSKIDKI
mmetsp:Transcript_40877/g.95879  ORF Transcript_40877/g.95879 Transcript_40877/m.95879 type:complete len:150 (-) Transcript_40877:618-1067(-)|eukprot:CAMPEP_0113312564 /NCGR_PEP_ID=MMETSP0010_2-20120614/9352_1 /TAXON_ID=216773 ORGANISM="Corethron hystrix, Strain 308" /NCGR_SAMPLE_ID=MMETSP0010_2 /ASSEMBLY_ACC=CAM_ASM_000155 /LENGTH=149 /DNA_ID=CAMNT_0000168431 /DNA_START=123 /DNA_END=572 /DNA_ORIENTATION=- /assembly_acc=CAM_ASM_000155